MSSQNSPYEDVQHGYTIATYILAPTLFLVGLMVTLYLCCNKKYKLNWFERTILDSHATTAGASDESETDETSRLREKRPSGSSRASDSTQGHHHGGLEGLVEEVDDWRRLGWPHHNDLYKQQQQQQQQQHQQQQRQNRQVYRSGVGTARVTPLSPQGEATFDCCSKTLDQTGYLLHINEQQTNAQQSCSLQERGLTSHDQLQRDTSPQQVQSQWAAVDAPPGSDRGKHSGRHQQQQVSGSKTANDTGSAVSGATPNGTRGKGQLQQTVRSAGYQSLSLQEQHHQQHHQQQRDSNFTSSSGRSHHASSTTTTSSAATTASSTTNYFSFPFFSSSQFSPFKSEAHCSTPPPPCGADGNHSTSSGAPWLPPTASGGASRRKYSLLVSDISPSSTSATSMGSLSSTPSLGQDGGPTGGGSSQSAPASRVSPRGSLTPEQFWVPPAVLQKKRAQSLIPSLLHHPDSDESSSPSRTPTTSTSLQEMAFSFPSEKLTETVSMVQTPAAGPPGTGHRARRRASMQDALDATMINTSLYDSIQVPQQPQEFGSIQEEHLGSIHFSLDYNPEQGLLTVRLIQARDLVPRDFSGTADPYCRLCLQPQRRPQLQSKLQKKTTSPEFGEDFIFEVMPDDIDQRTLEILVYDYDQYSRDEPIGEVCLPLEEVDLSETVALWKGISQPTKQAVVDDSLGDLMVSMSYLTSAERLTISVLKARYLQPPEDGKNTANPFVKVQVILGTKRLKKKKTSTKRNTLNPTWNEALVFNLSKDLLPRVTLEFLVCSDNLLGTNETLGKMCLGPDSSGEELLQWKDMIAVRSSNAMYHKLLPAPQESPVYQNLGRRCSDFS